MKPFCLLRLFVSVLLSAGLFSGCIETLPMGAGGTPEVTSCNSCHQSPPSTGLHAFHLFQQVKTAMPPVQCIDCHATSVRRMLWTPFVKEKVMQTLGDWDSLAFSSDTVLLFLSRVKSEFFKLCFTEVRGDSIFGSSVDSFSAFDRRFPTGDSIAKDENTIFHFPFDSSYDSVVFIDIGFPFPPDTDTVQIRLYSAPKKFDRCGFALRGDSLFQSVETPGAIFLRRLNGPDSLVYRQDFNRLYVVTPDTPFTLRRFLVRPSGKTPLRRFSSSERAQWLSPLGPSGTGVLVKIDTTWTGKDTLIADSIFQWLNYTLIALHVDSLLDYSSSIFAENTALHNNGFLDIGFKDFPVTLFHEDTVQEFIDSLTGLPVGSPIIKRTGAWRPERMSCMSSGISAIRCHERLQGAETFWYKREPQLLGKGRVYAP